MRKPLVKRYNDNGAIFESLIKETTNSAILFKSL